jgi:hypothetical protein
MSDTLCRCGHERGDHTPSLLWRAGTVKGLCSGACSYCPCQRFHKPTAPELQKLLNYPAPLPRRRR